MKYPIYLIRCWKWHQDEGDCGAYVPEILLETKDPVEAEIAYGQIDPDIDCQNIELFMETEEKRILFKHKELLTDGIYEEVIDDGV